MYASLCLHTFCVQEKPWIGTSTEIRYSDYSLNGDRGLFFLSRYPYLAIKDIDIGMRDIRLPPNKYSIAVSSVFRFLNPKYKPIELHTIIMLPKAT